MELERQGFRSVVFDCDSTLARIEGIDELAGERATEVRQLTERAMAGALALDEVYGHRLSLIAPTLAQVQTLGRAYVDALVEDARETVAALRWLGKEVRVLSGGLRPPVEALARELGLEPSAVAAVGISFHGDGSYRDFERGSPLARNGGKPEVIRAWGLPRPSLLVGDGATDLEARPAVDCFAAFMGVVHRPAVAAGADVVISAPSLTPVLALAAGDSDRARLRDSEWAPLLARGESLLTAGEVGGAV
ncbi:MAG TPA: HAD-IB family phosphatase [Longimicrobiaceae bacterium]|nr:HAD-IB family phosphatase [Longimicrobiaceae bacterium]